MSMAPEHLSDTLVRIELVKQINELHKSDPEIARLAITTVCAVKEPVHTVSSPAPESSSYRDIDERLDAHDPGRALELLDVDKDDNSLEALKRRASAYILQGKLKDAENIAQDIEATGSPLAATRALIVRARCSYNRNDYDTTLTLLNLVDNSGHESEPDILVKSHSLRLAALYSSGRHDELEKIWADSLSKLPDPTPGVLLFRAHLALRLGWDKDAREALDVPFSESSSVSRSQKALHLRKRAVYELVLQAKTLTHSEPTPDRGTHAQFIQLAPSVTQTQLENVLKDLERLAENCKTPNHRDERVLLLETRMMLFELSRDTARLVVEAERLHQLTEGHTGVMHKLGFAAVRDGDFDRVRELLECLKKAERVVSSETLHLTMMVEWEASKETEPEEVLGRWRTRLIEMGVTKFRDDPVAWEFVDIATHRVHNKWLSDEDFDLDAPLEECDVLATTIQITHLIRTERLEEAVKRTRDWLRLQRGKNQAEIYFAHIFYDAGKYRVACEFFDAWGATRAHLPSRIAHDWASALARVERWTEARTILDRALGGATTEERIRLLNLRSVCEHGDQDWPTFTNTYAEIRQLGGLVPRTQVSQAVALHYMGYSVECETQLDLVWKNHATDVSAAERFTLAQLDLRHEREERGLEELYRLTWLPDIQGKSLWIEICHMYVIEAAKRLETDKRRSENRSEELLGSALTVRDVESNETKTYVVRSSSEEVSGEPTITQEDIVLEPSDLIESLSKGDLLYIRGRIVSFVRVGSRHAWRRATLMSELVASEESSFSAISKEEYKEMSMRQARTASNAIEKNGLTASVLAETLGNSPVYHFASHLARWSRELPHLECRHRDWDEKIYAWVENLERNDTTKWAIELGACSLYLAHHLDAWWILERLQTQAKLTIGKKALRELQQLHDQVAQDPVFESASVDVASLLRRVSEWQEDGSLVLVEGDNTASTTNPQVLLDDAGLAPTTDGPVPCTLAFAVSMLRPRTDEDEARFTEFVYRSWRAGLGIQIITPWVLERLLLDDDLPGFDETAYGIAQYYCLNHIETQSPYAFAWLLGRLAVASILSQNREHRRILRMRASQLVAVFTGDRYPMFGDARERFDDPYFEQVMWLALCNCYGTMPNAPNWDRFRVAEWFARVFEPWGRSPTDEFKRPHVNNPWRDSGSRRWTDNQKCPCGSGHNFRACCKEDLRSHGGIRAEYLRRFALVTWARMPEMMDELRLIYTQTRSFTGQHPWRALRGS